MMKSPDMSQCQLHVTLIKGIDSFQPWKKKQNRSRMGLSALFRQFLVSFHRNIIKYSFLSWIPNPFRVHHLNWPNVSPSFRSSRELWSEISECVWRCESTYKCSPDKTQEDNSMLLAEGNWQAANGSQAAKPTSIEPHHTVIILSMRIVNVSPMLRGFKSV